MGRKWRTPAEIIGKLREAEVGLANGQTVPQVCRTLGAAANSRARPRLDREVVLT